MKNYLSLFIKLAGVSLLFVIFSMCTLGTPAKVIVNATTVTASTDLIGKISLSWSGVENATGYEVYRNANRIASLNASSTSYDDTTALFMVNYTYYISVIGADTTSKSNEVQGFSFPVTTDLTTDVKTLVNIGNDATVWLKVTADKSTAYQFYATDYYNYFESSRPSFEVNISIYDKTGTLISGEDSDNDAFAEIRQKSSRKDDKNLISKETESNLWKLRFISAADEYYYISLYEFTSGFYSGNSTVLFSEYKPAPPTSVVVSSSDSELSVMWTASTSALSYNIYYKEGNTVATTDYDEKLTDVTSPQTITGLTNNTNYALIITSVRLSAESDPTDKKIGTPTNLPRSTQPVISSISADLTDKITISWADVTDDSGYRILRSIDDVNYEMIAEVATDVITYDDISSAVNPILAKNTYYYKIISLGNGTVKSNSIESVSSTGKKGWIYETAGTVQDTNILTYESVTLSNVIPVVENRKYIIHWADSGNPQGFGPFTGFGIYINLYRADGTTYILNSIDASQLKGNSGYSPDYFTAIASESLTLHIEERFEKGDDASYIIKVEVIE